MDTQSHGCLLLFGVEQCIMPPSNMSCEYFLLGPSMNKLFCLLIFIASAAQAEQYTCTYSWRGKHEAHPVLIEVQGDRAVVKSGIFNETYEVTSNTSTELLMYRKFTKENSGVDYPVGFSTIALDKKTKTLARSNTFASSESNNHAFGKCQEVRGN